MSGPGDHVATLLVFCAIVLFWIGMVGLLWRRSLVGMLIGILVSWTSVGVVSIGFGFLQGSSVGSVRGGLLVLCASVILCLQIAIGLGVVVARIRRRGTLDADDAGLLEG